MYDGLDRRKFMKAASAAGLAGVAGCSGGPDDDGDGGAPADDEETADDEDTEATDDAEGEAETSVNVGMVYALGGLGDESFNDMAHRGIVDAAEEFGVNYDESQPSDAGEFSQFQRRYATETDPNYDLVSCIGFLQGDSLSETAPEHPDQNFMLVDEVVDEPNVASYIFKEHEGSFLIGVLSALLTQEEFAAGGGETNTESSTVGFVGGVDAPLIRKFQAGFEAGVQYAADSVDVTSSYVGDFADPSGGQEAALSMYESGADIVYHAAGGTGVGVFQAAQEQGRFAMGVDADQSLTNPQFADVILASMVKRVDSAVYESVETVVNGEFQGGSRVELGLESDGVAAVYGDEIGGDVPDEITAEVDAAAEAIIEGEVDVPDTVE